MKRNDKIKVLKIQIDVKKRVLLKGELNCRDLMKTSDYFPCTQDV